MEKKISLSSFVGAAVAGNNCLAAGLSKASLSSSGLLWPHQDRSILCCSLMQATSTHIKSGAEQSQHSLPHVGVTIGNKSAAFLACDPWSHRLCLGPETEVSNPFQSFTVISLIWYEGHSQAEYLY